MLIASNFVRLCMKTQNKRQPFQSLLVAPQSIAPFVISIFGLSASERVIIGLEETTEILIRDKKCPSLECPTLSFAIEIPKNPLGSAW